MKNKKTILTVLACVVLGIVIASQYFTYNRGKENFGVFYNADINGVIGSAYIKQKNAAFLVSGQEYIFHPYTGPLNHETIFYDIAKAGDSVIKPAKGDTLVLVHKGDTYKYTFGKFD